jgi:hypothetical protein
MDWRSETNPPEECDNNTKVDTWFKMKLNETRNHLQNVFNEGHPPNMISLMIMAYKTSIECLEENYKVFKCFRLYKSKPNHNPNATYRQMIQAEKDNLHLYNSEQLDREDEEERRQEALKPKKPIDSDDEIEDEEEEINQVDPSIQAQLDEINAILKTNEKLEPSPPPPLKIRIKLPK